MDLRIYFPDIKGGRALDIGTRFGEFAERLYEIMPTGSFITGIDSDLKAIETAKTKHPEESFVFEVMDGAHLEYADNSFELVALSNTLHHIEDYDSVLKEMKRVLKPGGYFVINEMFCDEQNPAQEVHVAQHTFEAELDMIRGTEFQAPTFTKAQIKEIFEKQGLNKVNFYEFLEDAIYDEKLAEKNGKLLDAVEKIKDKPEYETMKKKAQTIQEMFAKDGIKRCTQLLCVGEK